VAKSKALTVYLLRGTSPEPDTFIKLDPLVRPHPPIALESWPPFFLYSKSTNPQPPRWADFFIPHIDPREIGLTNSVSAALLVRVHDLWCAVTFGQGRHLLLQGACVDGFGLRVALNTIGSSNIRSIDKDTFDMIAGHARQQASREVGAADFGVDVERDLLSAVTGTPRENAAIGERITGRDALCSSIQLGLEELPAYLTRLCDLYETEFYKDDFPWVDNVHVVEDAEEVGIIDLELTRLLQEGQWQDIWLAPPEVLEWPRVRTFAYSLSARHPELHDVSLKTFVRFVAKNDRSRVDVPFLQGHRVYCIDEDGKVSYDWSVYSCIYAQIVYSSARYFLTNGKWYKVSESLVGEVNAFYDQVAQLEHYLPEYDDESEGDYNRRVGQGDSQFDCMHEKLVQFGPGRSKIEFCDLLGREDGTTYEDIVHVKRYSGSRDLSHLFAQGLNSGELFQIDVAFRLALDKDLPEGFRGRFVETRPERNELRIVFAIISEVDEPLNLPFFARLSLRHVARRLVGFGYRVALARIRVKPERAILQRNFRRRSKDKRRRRAAGKKSGIDDT